MNSVVLARVENEEILNILDGFFFVSLISDELCFHHELSHEKIAIVNNIAIVLSERTSLVSHRNEILSFKTESFVQKTATEFADQE